MKVAIVGSRNFNDYNKLVKFIHEHVDVDKITKIVSGGAWGVDRLAEQFANEHKIILSVYHPDWNRYGKRAGPIRNRLIVDDADIIIAFWDYESKGTASTIQFARQENKILHICRV